MVALAKRKGALAFRLGSAVLVALSQYYLHFSNFGSQADYWLQDQWFRLRGARTAPSEIVVISMDEDSYRVLDVPLGQPWPRILHAKLLQRLHQLGVERVVFDIIFAGAGLDPQIDQEFAEAIGLSPTVLGVDLGTKEHEYYSTQELIEPFNKFAENASTSALVGLPEVHGVVRGFFVDRFEMAESFASLAEAALGYKTNPRIGPDAQNFPDRNALLNFYGPAGTIKTISYYQVLELEHPLPVELLKDKIVFVGLMMRTGTGPQQKDSYLTSFDSLGRTFGVEIHATAAANLLHDDWIHRYDSRMEARVLALLAFLGTMISMSLPPHLALLGLLGMVLAWTGLSYKAMTLGIFIPGASWAGITMPICFIISAMIYYVVARRAFRQTKLAFQHYLTPEMVRQVAKNPEALKPGGVKVEATALFMDIADFTSISERMSAEQVSAMLNAYFTVAGDVIFKFRGTLIKYIGDAIFVIWGAPIPQSNHGYLACQAAIEIQSTIEKFNKSGRFEPLKTRIGVNSGPMVIGNLGSARRFDYTAIGDAVNLASRIEGANKFFGTEILVSKSSLQYGQTGLFPIPIGEINLKGKQNSVELFALFNRNLNSQAVQNWSQALGYYKNKELQSAKGLFELVKNQEIALAKAASVYLEKISVESNSSAQADWTHLVVLDEK